MRLENRVAVRLKNRVDAAVAIPAKPSASAAPKKFVRPASAVRFNLSLFRFVQPMQLIID